MNIHQFIRIRIVRLWIITPVIFYFSHTFANEKEVDVEFYGSLRIGLDFVDAGTPDDAINGRDFLSRIGLRAQNQIDDNLTGVVVLEYGMRSENFVDVEQNDSFSRRLTFVGLKGDWGEVYYGSQNIIFHTFLRGSYFNDFNDTLRQATIRDDDLLQYFYSSKKWKIGVGTQFEGQDGDSVDQFEIAGEYVLANTKFQLGLVKDNRGENTGELIGARFWWYPNAAWTLSAYYQFANEDFDLYAGSTTGNVRLRDGETEGNVNGVRSCPTEDRLSTGLYAGYKKGNHTIHGRLATDSCDQLGDVDSVKVEYVFQLYSNFRTWLAVESLSNDDSRAPLSSSGESLSVIQTGVRYDF